MRFLKRSVLAWITILILGSSVSTILAASDTDSMVGYWKLDETLAPSVKDDSSGDGHFGTIGGVGGPTPTTTKPTLNFPNDRALDFDGNDYVEVADESELNPSTFTIAFWVKFDTINSTHRTLVAKWQVGVRQQFTVQLTSGNVIGFWTGDGSTGSSGALTSALTPTTGTWYHITAVANGTNRALYINGTANKYTGTGTSPGSSNVELTFGSKKSAGGTYFEYLDGQMDDIRMYNRALSDTEVDALAAGNHTLATWTANSSGDWEEAGNWNINAVPDPYTLITVANAPIQATLTTDVAFAGLTINSGGLFDLDGHNITMNDSGTITNNGIIEPDGNETLTNIPLTDIGAVRYQGSGTYNSLNFGNSYSSLEFELGNYSLNAPLTVGDINLVSGTLNANGQNITVSGGWTNSGGTFTPSGNTVILSGTNQTILGSNTFYNLTKTVSSAATLRFPTSATQTITNTLTLQGAAGNLLSLRSNVNNVQANFNPQGTRNISYIDAKDSNNVNATAIAYSSTNTYGANLTNWLTSAPALGLTTPSNTGIAAPACSSSALNQVPDLYQIDAQKNSAILHFKTVSGATGYRISYGLDKSANQYGDNFDVSNQPRLIERVISSLAPNTVYYFKIQAANGCNGGGWSQVKSIRTGSKASGSSNVLGTSISNECSHQVQSGDSLWAIAAKKWGSGAKYSQIINLNQGLSADLKIGQLLKLCT